MTIRIASPRPAVLAAIPALFVAMLMLTPVSGGTPDIDAQPLHSNLCGPLCIRYVLQSYGMDESVLTISDALRVSEHRDGVSFLAIRDFLASRGITAVGMRFTGKKPDWPYPAILHVLSEKDKRGHFIVLCPKREGHQTTIWDSGRQYASEDLLDRTTGFALLTAPPGCDRCLSVGTVNRNEFLVSWLSIVALPFSGFVMLRQLWHLAVKQ